MNGIAPPQANRGKAGRMHNGAYIGYNDFRDIVSVTTKNYLLQSTICIGNSMGKNPLFPTKTAWTPGLMPAARDNGLTPAHLISTVNKAFSHDRNKYLTNHQTIRTSAHFQRG